MFGETIISLLIFFGSIFMYYAAGQLRQFEAYQNVGPDFWPKLVTLLLILISGYLSVSNIIKVVKSKQADSDSVTDIVADHRTWLRVSIASLIIIIYVLLLKPIGFIVLSPIFIAVMMFMIQPNKKKAIPIGMVGIMAIIYALFGQLLSIPLPKGQGVFRTFSISLGL